MGIFIVSDISFLQASFSLVSLIFRDSPWLANVKIFAFFIKKKKKLTLNKCHRLQDPSMWQVHRHGQGALCLSELFGGNPDGRFFRPLPSSRDY